jgi:RNA polymerase sigma factor (sigma-70 family)
MTEQELIKGSAKNDKVAQKILFEQNYHEVLKLCIRYSKNNLQAEEMALSGMHKVFEQIKKFNPAEQDLSEWIKKVVIQNNVSVLKTNMQEYYIVSTVKAIDNSIFVNSNNVEEIENEVWFTKCDSKQVLSAIQHLPPSLRVSYNMQAVDGYSVQEIADVLEISESTAYSNLEKARNTLKRNLYSEYKTNN